jgi:AcrR family transcriptional regulator
MDPITTSSSIDPSVTKGEKTRQKIIDIACQLFVNEGYHATSTREITEKTGLSPSSLYNHFKTKNDIFLAVIEKYHPWHKIPEALLEAKGDEVESYLRDASNCLMKSWDKNPELMRLHLIELLEFKGQHLPSLFRKIFAEASTILNRLITEREGLKGTSPALFARAILGLFFGYMMTNSSLSETENNSIMGDFDYFADTYLQGFFSKEVDKSMNRGDL